MLGGKRSKFGFTRRRHLTSETKSFIIVGVRKNGEILHYGEYDTFEQAKRRVANIEDTELMISIFTEANRTVYREER